MERHIELAGRAERDLRKITGTERQRIRQGLVGLARGAQGDVKALAGRAPWLRIRLGDYRVLYRPLTADEMRRLGRTGEGYLVARVVHRRDLEQAVGTL